MYVMISTKDSQAVGALLLAVSKTKMRLAVPGKSDALELTLIEGQWTAENGDQVSLDSIIQTGELDLLAIGGDVFPKTMAAN